jgi:TonB family protein
MKSRFDFSMAFLLAVVFHACAGYCAGKMLFATDAGIRPVFSKGETSVLLDLSPVVPQIEIKKQEFIPEEPLPEDAPDLIVESEESEEKKEPEELPDSDLGAKGVENTPSLKAAIYPHYPLGSRIRGEEGIVQVRITVSSQGRADAIEVITSSGHPALDNAAVDALRKAQFVNSDGALASSGEVVLSFRFRLLD